MANLTKNLVPSNFNKMPVPNLYGKQPTPDQSDAFEFILNDFDIASQVKNIRHQFETEFLNGGNVNAPMFFEALNLCKVFDRMMEVAKGNAFPVM